MPGAAQPVPIRREEGKSAAECPAKNSLVIRCFLPVSCGIVSASGTLWSVCHSSCATTVPAAGAKSRCRPARCAPCRSTPARLPQSARGYQHSAAGKICTQHRPIALCPQPVQRACGDLRAGMGRGSLHRKPAFFKIQACPRELAAFQQGILSGAQQLLGYGSAGLQSRSCAALHPPAPRCPVVRLP